MVEYSSFLVSLPFPVAAFPFFSRPSPLSLHFFVNSSLSFLSDTACGTRKRHPELGMFSYFIKCDCRVGVIQSMVQTPMLQFWQTCQDAPLISAVVEGSSKGWDWFRARLRGVTIN